MKIACNDNCSWRFSQPIIDHWISRGHEVRTEIGANPEFGKWADLVYIDWLDNNFLYYFRDRLEKKQMAVRAIDIDIWMQRHKDRSIWTYLDDMITISTPMYNKILEESQPPLEKLHLIKPGVDLNKFTFKRKSRGYNVCMIISSFWEMKNMLEGFRIFQLVVKKYPTYPWKLHIRGKQPDGERELEITMREHVLNHNIHSDRVVMYDKHIDDLNAWYDQMDYIIVPSMKEAFSYACGEAMAKGIKPVLNNWWGVDTIWPKEYVYNDLDEAADMIVWGSYDPERYRNYIEKHYDLKRMLEEYDQLFGT